LKDAVSLTLKEIKVDSSKEFPLKEKKQLILSGRKRQEDEGDKFFLTEDPSSWEFVNNDSFTKEFLDSIRSKDSNTSIEDEDILKMLLNDTNEISGVQDEKYSSDFIEMDSEFLLNNPNASTKKFGSIKVNTFNEWARLSLLEYDSQISYNGTKLPNLGNLVKELKNMIKKTDFQKTNKVKTKSHLKESLKAMKFILQKNALELLNVKDESKGLNTMRGIKPSPLVVSL